MDIQVTINELTKARETTVNAIDSNKKALREIDKKLKKANALKEQIKELNGNTQDQDGGEA